MKVLIARMNHETNTFSPVPTPLSAFGRGGPAYGDDARRENEGARTAMGAFIDLAKARGAGIVTPLSAWAYPSGPVHADAYDAMCARILDAVPGCEAIFLDLHGAMVAQNSDDGEGDLLARVRAAAPGVPIAVALDLHGNVTARMVENADVIVSFKTYPHVDMYETGEHAGRLLWETIDGRFRPVMAWRRPPLMTHTLRSATDAGAMRDAVQAAREAETSGVAAASVLAGFGLADIPHPCISVVVVADGDRALAESVAERIAAQIWRQRDGFVYRSEPLADSLARAQAMAAGARRPILLLDHGDNCNSGGTCDTTAVLEAALARGMKDILAGVICDPEAVARMIEAGVGARVTLPLGNKRSLAFLGIDARPMQASGVVRAITDGEYVITGPTYTGMRVGMGRTAVLDLGDARVVVSEQTHEPWDLAVFESVGEDPRRARFLLLKSRMYCRPVFVPISDGLVECDSPGVTTSDYGIFPYAKRARPLYPLEDAAFDPAQPGG
ncbi:microcystin degradation protein MlrC [Bordetella genomosp. 9]|uniref:M81 family metallopeptidase n=1 Tax=Bordetella genomosp. 9 TaxID=1416803 RepID=UPI000A28D858|nr:M81 family metallopeptidase [Bordetella genomosp. 9]ARP89460.1 microcystin degradation protein MlrC [Bordetella genomosp. 9]